LGVIGSKRIGVEGIHFYQFQAPRVSIPAMGQARGHRPNEAITLSRNGFHIDGLVRGITEGQTELVHRGIHVRVVINVGTFRPELGSQIVAAHYFARSLQQSHKRLVNLARKLDSRSIFKKLFALQVYRKAAKAQKSLKFLIFGFGSASRCQGLHTDHFRTHVRPTWIDRSPDALALCTTSGPSPPPEPSSG